MIRYFCDRCGKSSKEPLKYIVEIFNKNGHVCKEAMLCVDCGCFISDEINAQNLKEGNEDEPKTK